MTTDQGRYWTQLARGRSSRREVLRGAALGGVGLAAAALLGCGGEDEPAPAPAATTAGGAGSTATATATATAAAASEIKRGGTYHVSQTAPFNDVPDPHTSLAQAWTSWTWFGEGLVKWSQDATEIVPILLESWEPSPDGTELVLNVRKGVQWHDRPPFQAREFDAEDVAYNLKRIGSMLGLAKDEGKVFHRKASMAGMVDAVPVDQHTVKVTFEKPSSVFITGLTNGRNSMVPREFPEQFDFSFETAVGTGAWVIDTFEDEVKAVFKKNPSYWREGQPYMDAVEWLWVPDVVSAQAAFAQGQVEYINAARPIERQNIAKLAPKASLVSWPFNSWTHFRFNTLRKPFDDPRLRKALQLVIKPGVIADQQLGEGFYQLTGPLASGFGEAIPADEIVQMPGWNPATKEQDIKTAKDLMSAAGFPDGNLSFPVMASGPAQTSAEVTIRASEMWKAVWPGIDAQVDLTPDQASFGKRQGGQDFDVVQYSIFGEGDAQIELASNYGTTGGRNYGKFSDPKVDEMLETAFRQFDLDERKETLLDLQHYLIDEQLPIITMYLNYAAAFMQPWVKGFEHGGPLGGNVAFDFGREAYATWLDK